jgi:hypothetical protein
MMTTTKEILKSDMTESNGERGSTFQRILKEWGLLRDLQKKIYQTFSKLREEISKNCIQGH